MPRDGLHDASRAAPIHVPEALADGAGSTESGDRGGVQGRAGSEQETEQGVSASGADGDQRSGPEVLDAPAADPPAPVPDAQPAEEVDDDVSRPADKPAPAAPRVAPTPVVAAPSHDLRGLRDLICSKPWPCEQAIRVATCESTLRPRAISPDGANWGLFQINRVHAGRVGGNLSALLDAATNVQVAFAIWSEQGWMPWSCRP